MKNVIKLGVLSVIFTIFITGSAIAVIPKEDVGSKTLIDYLNDKNVSFLIVNSGTEVRLTTVDWQDASQICKIIRTAGFNV